jgi:hypothetical protein
LGLSPDGLGYMLVLQIQRPASSATNCGNPGAHVQAGTGATGVTDATGHYALTCVPVTQPRLPQMLKDSPKPLPHAHARAGGATHINLQLAVASVRTDVQVSANANGADGGHSAARQSSELQKCNDFRMIRTNFFANCGRVFRRALCKQWQSMQDHNGNGCEWRWRLQCPAFLCF